MTIKIPTTGARSAVKSIFGKDGMPLGFRNNGWGTAHGVVNIGGYQLGTIYSYQATHDFAIRGVPGVGNWTKDDSCSFDTSYVTENDWPTALLQLNVTAYLLKTCSS